MSDIDTAVVDSLKVLDPNRPIREADIGQLGCDVRTADSLTIRLTPASRAASIALCCNATVAGVSHETIYLAQGRSTNGQGSSGRAPEPRTSTPIR